MDFLLTLLIKVIEAIVSTITKEHTKKCLNQPNKPKKKPPLSVAIAKIKGGFRNK